MTEKQEEIMAFKCGLAYMSNDMYDEYQERVRGARELYGQSMEACREMVLREMFDDYSIPQKK